MQAKVTRNIEILPAICLQNKEKRLKQLILTDSSRFWGAQNRTTDITFGEIELYFNSIVNQGIVSILNFIEGN